MSSKSDVAQITTQIYNLLKNIAADERRRAISAALTLLGEEPTISQASGGNTVNQYSNQNTSQLSAANFFQEKDPHNKIEELAVAARFRENTMNAHTHTKEELEKVFKDARRNFDRNNFKRDLDNAKTKGFFTRDREITLAYIGQKFVDSLPNRDIAKNIKKRKRGKSKTKKNSK
jgi:hypothetical protein